MNRIDTEVRGLLVPRASTKFEYWFKYGGTIASSRAWSTNCCMQTSVPAGYPKFWIYNQEPALWWLAGGIINNAEHQAMLPYFLALGYSEEEFLGPCRLRTDREQRVVADIRGMTNHLTSPVGYQDQVGKYLQKNGIAFEAVFPSRAIIQRKLDRQEKQRVREGQ